MDFGTATLIAFSTLLAVSGSFLLNDAEDHKIDRFNKPNRPVASGKLPRSSAMTSGFFLLFSSSAICLPVNLELGFFWMTASALSIFYTYILKPNIAFLANILSATLTSSICFIGFFASGKIEAMATISIAVFFACLSREVAKDVEDLPGDKGNRTLTLPMIIGSQRATKISLILIIGQIVFSYLPLLTDFFGATYFLGISFVNSMIILSLLLGRLHSATAIQTTVKTSMASYLLVYLLSAAATVI